MDGGIKYVAGFFDADGCVGVYRKGVPTKAHPSAHRRLHIIISNTDKNVLAQIQKILGFGKIHKGGRPGAPHHKQPYRLQMYSRQAAKVARMLIPYLILKKQKMIDCLEEYESNVLPRGRPPKGS